MNEGEVHYRFLSLIGAGGFGKVYRARVETAEGFQRDVAIKLLNDPNPPKSLLQRFRDEAKILGLVRDRAIVGVEPPIRIGDQWAVVMEFIDGVSAGALIEKGFLPPGVAVEVVGEVARALHNAFHMEGPEGGPLALLHRDIKPDNIQITPTGDVRLLDFGIARANFAKREFHTRQSLGGTPGYIAPERLQRVEVPEGDVYSLGVVLHELVTGTRPRFSPTVHLETTFVPDDGSAALLVGSSGVVVDSADLEVDAALLADPHLMEVLALAGWMRAHEPEQRPSARQVEEACRDLRQKLPAPYLRNWAEEHVPHRNELDPDERVGSVMSTTGVSIIDATQPPAPAAAVPPQYPTASMPPTPSGDSRSGVAVGAVLGGGFALLLTAAIVLISAGGMGLGWFLFSAPDARTDGTPVAVEPVPDPLPDPVPDAVEPVPEPLPDPVPVPDPVKPVPVKPGPTKPTPVPTAPTPPPKPDPVVIALPGTTTPAPDPAPAPIAPAPSRSGPTGLVIVRTIPSGATVREKGQILTATGRGYLLPTGSHVLDVESPSGERTRIPVFVRTDESVEICYSFDTNSACGQ